MRTCDVTVRKCTVLQFVAVPSCSNRCILLFNGDGKRMLAHLSYGLHIL